MEILVPVINWISVYILLKTIFKKIILKSTSPYYQLSIYNLIIFNFLKDIILFFICSFLFYYGLQSNIIFPNSIKSLINWILIFTLSKSLFELLFCFFIKNFGYKFVNLIRYFAYFNNNFTVEKSFIRTLFSIPWVILTYLLYRYT